MFEHLPTLTIALDASTCCLIGETIARHLSAAGLSFQDTTATEDHWLDAPGAADYLGVTKKRIYDLTSARAIVPAGRDGRRPLFTRSQLDLYARGGPRTAARGVFRAGP
jgi:excisionase family DNA binding protein